ncbi:putative fungal domain of unknown function (DUF1750) [Lyophyllum shimeji]|uniref:SWI/SNF and RSC complexes subunit Ssr4 N-terminal domain-containing protein n=1 Tax=Lyophyllum shimeji TaxID=47721 RepID=A0A9P3UP46_LYOSH|nr:putative fungal domain of unknown function (DUF1750) [Lyophyllum shimeji]
MASSFQQAQAEGLCLRYPENLGLHREINYEAAVSMLTRAMSMATTVPFSWGFVDKPPEGQVLLLFLPPQNPFPIDGLRFQEQEVKFTIPVGTSRELEVHEVKFGFIPGSADTNAWRCRRRYRLTKGGNPQLVLVHYTQGPQTQILPSLMNQPVRNYPLRIVNEPAVYVAGEKMGTKVYPPGGAPMPSAAPPMQQPGMAMNFSQQQAMVAQQNSSMEMLERRREQERARNRSGSTSGRPPRPEDDDSGDEIDQISTRTLALNRYRRNHDMMNEVFKFAAYGDKNAPPPPPPYSIFNKTEIEEKTAKLQEEIEALKSKSSARRAAQLNWELETRPDVTMDVEGGGITA